MPGPGDESTAKSDPLRHLRLPPGKKISLHVVAGPEKGKTFACTQPRVAIGREKVNLTLNDAQVSQVHCVVEISGDQVMLRDLDSTNGTFIEDRRIRQAPLEHLSEFRLGRHTLVLMIVPDYHAHPAPDREAE